MNLSLSSIIPSGNYNRGISGSERAKPALFIACLVLFGLLVVALCASANPGVGVLIALAITGTIAVVGFLFGIPRSAGGDGTANSSATSGATATASASSRPRNASLEQVADWLTKLMLGAGLTQLAEIKHGILTLAKVIAHCYGPVATDRVSPEGLVFGLGVIGFFSACGFLGGYLSTRLLLARLLTVEDLDIDQIQKDAEKKGLAAGRDQIERDVNAQKIQNQQTATTAAATADPAVKAALAAAEAWQPPAAETVANDPQKNRFGGQPQTATRRLSAVVKAPNDGASELFQIVLTVDSIPGAPPLVSAVKFFLHDTFPKKTIIVPATKGSATLELVGWGAFTVGAITDDGKTLLELDLATLAGAPQKFRDR